MAGNSTRSVATQTPVHWPKIALRIGFGVIWLVDAAFKWLPGFRSDYVDTLKEGSEGQPGWLKGWFDFWINLQQPNATFFAYLVAVTETLIAVALIAGFARKLTYTAALVFSLLIWSTAEGFGGPYTSGSEDVGTAIIYAFVFAALLAFAYYHGTSQLSVDAYLERRISWWHRIAEVGHRHYPTAPRSTPATPQAPSPGSHLHHRPA